MKGGVFIMKILVTGGAGFIGSHIVEDLTQHQHDVLVIDNLSHGVVHNLPAGTPLIKADVCGIKAVSSVHDYLPDAVVHLAAQMDVSASIRNPMADAAINVLGTANMLAAARDAGASVFVGASSGGAVYGDPPSLPASELTPVAPLSPYGVSKRAGELYMEYYERCSAMRCVALRLANVYGPRQGNGGEAGVVAVFTQRMLKNEPPLIFGDGKQTRDFVYVKDVACAVRQAVESSASGAFNICSNTETNLLDLSGQLSKLTGCDQKPAFMPSRTGEVNRSRLDYTLAERMLDWRPQISLDHGLAATVESMKDRPAAPPRRPSYQRAISIHADKTHGARAQPA
jgi:UDP-glucose 4-epimerase